MRLEFLQAAAIAEARLVDNETTLGPARLANGPGKNQEPIFFHEMLGPVYTIIVLRFFHTSCDLFPTTILQLYNGYLAKEIREETRKEKLELGE